LGDPALTQLRKIAVFGGTGFLGRRIVGHLLEHGFAVRVASRHPERTERISRDQASALESIRADVNDDESVLAAVTDVFAVINAVSLYLESNNQTFHSVHVEAAGMLAKLSRQSRVERFAHVSGIGADAASASRYIRSRGRGEGAVRSAFATATIIRPAVMFGPDDAFLNPIIRLLRTLPVFPLFGRGQTALQPSYVEDVAEAIVRALQAPQPQAVYELGGPRTYTYENLLRTVGEHLGFRPILAPVPFELWRALAFMAEKMPNPPVTRNQVELMEIDCVASPDYPGFSSLAIDPRGIEFLLSTVRETGETHR
jgi:uncharacterized protein YbjT (DUF2867 family)